MLRLRRYCAQPHWSTDLRCVLAFAGATGQGLSPYDPLALSHGCRSAVSRDHRAARRRLDQRDPLGLRADPHDFAAQHDVSWVRAGLVFDHIIARPAVDDISGTVDAQKDLVVTCAAMDDIPASARGQFIAPTCVRAAPQGVPAPVAADDVAAESTTEYVVMIAALDEVLPGAAAEDIVVAPAVEEVEEAAAYEEIRPPTAPEVVDAASAKHDVIA